LTPTLISVIVPAHQAGNGLDDTLASLAAQSYDALEVLVVDDGVGTAEGAGLPDERFRLIKSRGTGLLSRGAARNLGVAEATGDYLAFADAGDVLPGTALAALHASLAASGSDFAAGNVAVPRSQGHGTVPSPLHKGVFAAPLTGTRVRRRPALLQDRYVTNKLFRRSFWDEQALRFPDIDRDADLAVTIPAHYLAAAVDMLSQVVLRRAEDVVPALSTEPQDLADGFAAVEQVVARLADHWRAKDRRRFVASALDRELRVFLDSLPDADDERRAQIMERAAAYAADVDPKALASLPALTRLKWYLAGRRLRTELVKVVRYERGRSKPAIVRDGLRRYVAYPYWKDQKLAIPRRIYRARSEIKLRSRVHEVTWQDGRLVVRGEAYINAVSTRRRWTSVTAIALRRGRRTLVLPARQRRNRGSRAWFDSTLDPRRLRRRGRWVDGTWKVQAAVFNTGVFRHGGLLGGASGTGAHPPYHYVSDDVRIVPAIVDGTFRIKVETVHAQVTALAWSGDELEITGVVRDGTPAGLRLTRDEETLTVPVTADAETFQATIPLSRLGDGDEDPLSIDDTRTWTVSVSVTGRRPIPLVMGRECEPAQTLIDAAEAIAEPDTGGYLRLRVRTAQLIVTALSWAEDGTLSVTGAHPSHERGEIVLRARSRRLDLAYGFSGGTASVPAAATTTLAGVLPLRAGKWDVLFRPSPAERALAVSLDRDAAAALPTSVEVARRGYTAHNHDGHLMLDVTGDLTQEERGSQQRLREQSYRRVEKTGLKDAVLYSCFNGRQYGCNPRAIHEEMARQRIDLPQLWVVNDAQAELPGTVTPIRLHSEEWHDAIAACRYIVTNHRIGDWFQRHPEQVVLQTWHGTPLKKIGRDVKEVHFAYAPGMKQALQRTAAYPKLAEWSYLLSPNPFSTKIMKRAFSFKGEIIEAGYPRNDVLYSADAPSIAASVRARIGIPDGKSVVLYAPTWRDDQFYSRGRYKFEMPVDLDRARAALGDDHVLLVRLHSNIVDGVPNAGDGFVYDVSLYPEIAELYLISDVLVTDYSSAMFDYANTRRPMLFFTYDLADYRDRLRGFYFDFEAEAPGPLLETSDALIEALRSADDAVAPFDEAYDGFVERFCSLEDGKASARVIDRILRDR
jgi:CDP-glycerol glycerophosphotransferase